jgi:hypothetical protein
MMHKPDAPLFQPRRSMEDKWTPQLLETPDIDETSLPVIWDAISSSAREIPTGTDTYVRFAKST